MAGNHTVVGDGSGISSSGDVVLKNCTVAGNIADSGQGCICVTGCLLLANSIVSRNYLDDEITTLSVICYLHCDYLRCIIDEDPHFFRDPISKPAARPTDVNDFLLRPNSPAIDAGEAVLAKDYDESPLLEDIRGAPRTVGDAVDIGAYEFQDMFGDIDGDEEVDIDDFIILKQNYGVGGAYKSQGDFDGDRDVDIDDFIILKQNYGNELSW